MRIVSLVPSLTELLFDLGLENEVVGITKFCVHPESARQNKTQVGGTKNPSIERILQLKPDLVIANREENRREDIEALREHTSVLVTDISDVCSALEAIRIIGLRTNRLDSAESLISSIQNERLQLKELQKLHPLEHPIRVLYVIWRNPVMAVGGDTYISSLIQEVGALSVTADQTRYPDLTDAQIRALDPDEIWLSDEPYPFTASHCDEWSERFPNCRVQLVSGEQYSWYGSRMLHSFRQLQNQYKEWVRDGINHSKIE